MVGLTTNSCAGFKVNRRRQIIATDTSTHRLGERKELTEVVKKLKGSSQKVVRAQILLKADADGPNWTHPKIAEAYLCRIKTVENVSKSLVESGFEVALNGKNAKRHHVPSCSMVSRKPALLR